MKPRYTLLLISLHALRNLNDPGSSRLRSQSRPPHRQLARPNRIRAVWTSIVLLAILYMVADLPSRLGLYHATSKIPAIQFGVLAPLRSVLLLFFLLETLPPHIEAIPQQWLVGIQFYRVLGVIFLILYAMGKLPAAFAIPAGVGDVLVGLAAPSVALRRHPQIAQRRQASAPMEPLGLADLAVALTTGFLTSPSPIQLLARNHPNEHLAVPSGHRAGISASPSPILLHLALSTGSSGPTKPPEIHRSFHLPSPNSLRMFRNFKATSSRPKPRGSSRGAMERPVYFALASR